MTETDPVPAAIGQQAADLGSAAPVGNASPAAIGAQMQASGAAVTSIDPDTLLDMIRKLQAKVDSMQAAAGTAAQSEVVRLADTVAGHVQAHANATRNPELLAPAVAIAQQIPAAAAEAEDGTPEKLTGLLGQLGAWLARHGHKTGTDTSHLEELVTETLPDAVEAAAKG